MRHFRLTHTEPELGNTGAIIAAFVIALAIGILGIYIFDTGLVKMQLVSASDLAPPPAQSAHPQ